MPKTATKAREYVSCDEAAERMNVSSAFVRGALKRNEFPGAIDVSSRPGVTRPRYRIPLSALAKFEETRAVNAAA